MTVNVVMHLLQECAWCSTSSINTSNIFVWDIFFFFFFLLVKAYLYSICNVYVLCVCMYVCIYVSVLIQAKSKRSFHTPHTQTIKTCHNPIILLMLKVSLPLLQIKSSLSELKYATSHTIMTIIRCILCSLPHYFIPNFKGNNLRINKMIIIP